MQAGQPLSFFYLERKFMLNTVFLVHRFVKMLLPHTAAAPDAAVAAATRAAAASRAGA